VSLHVGRHPPIPSVEQSAQRNFPQELFIERVSGQHSRQQQVQRAEAAEQLARRKTQHRDAINPSNPASGTGLSRHADL
jgi:hypothetical protein